MPAANAASQRSRRSRRGAAPPAVPRAGVAINVSLPGWNQTGDLSFCYGVAVWQF